MISRWEPFRESRRLHDMLDRIMEDAMLNRSGVDAGEMLGVPMDVYQTDDEIVFKVTVPGVRPEDLDISVTGETLTIRGEIKQERDVGDGEKTKYLLRERRYGQFSRSLNLPTLVNADKADATFENGILTLVLPKVEEVKPKAITVKAK